MYICGSVWFGLKKESKFWNEYEGLFQKYQINVGFERFSSFLESICGLF